MAHPDFTTLFLAAGKRAGAAPPASVRPHLASCASCRGEWDLARSVQSAIRTDEMIAPPATVLKSAIALWKQAHPGRLGRALEVIRAALVFDSFNAPQLATVRRAAPASKPGQADSRRLLYRAGSVDVDIAIDPVAAGRGRKGTQLLGQIVSRSGRGGSSGGGATIRFEGASRRTIAASSDERGVFRFDSVPPGRYRVKVLLAGTKARGGTEILIESLTIKR